MKYKLLSKEQLLISFDRLTRFKNTKEKYIRVFTDIILSNLIEPSYKKSELVCMPPDELTHIAELIINDSLISITPPQPSPSVEGEERPTPTLTLPRGEGDEVLTPPQPSPSVEGEERPTPTPTLPRGEGEKVSTSASTLSKGEGENLNYILKEYENSVFNNDDETQEFLNNKIQYDLFLPLINESSPINLRWLKMINESDNLSKLRADNGLKFPIIKVILVEGITEEILLPAFSKYLGFDFYKEGIQIIPAGGKNQVVKLYYKLADELKIPIFLLLDKDAEDNIKQIRPKLRDIDKIHLVSCGEFEDLLPKSLIVKTINNELCNFASITKADLDDNNSEVENLENIFKTKGLHEFKKAEFAKLVKDNISQDSDISAEIASIIMEISLG